MNDDAAQVQIDLPMEAIAAFCRKWQLVEFALFGSVLRPDFNPESDIDVLVTYGPDAAQTLDNLLAMADELEALFEREVDLLDRHTVERSRNYLRRRAILGSTRTIYAA
ncbi:MAG: nucleotidyltransferase domain-containing protein [Anaerolineae bacterium]|nr:nucleotidyltransferase domain-containing protein [Anaerolineae bacterium]